MDRTSPRDRVIVALDVPTPAEATALAGRLGGAIAFYKVGLELIHGGGLPLVERFKEQGKRVFLDAKLFDIDNTIAGAVAAIATTGADFLTIHAYPKAMRAAVDARGDVDLKLLGVTVLTSMDDADVAAAGYGSKAADLALQRAEDARAAGMDGVIAAPAEAAAIRAAVGPDMLIVTPGIRPAGTAAGDQKRIATPADAIRAGADYLVVGRAITAADDPAATAEAVVAEVASVWAGTPRSRLVGNLASS